MRLKNLFIAGFRNLDSVRFSPAQHFNLIHGHNGQGKTNLLEALYLLGNSRSFRNARLPDFVGYERKQAQIKGEIESSGINTHIKVTLENAGRRVELDGKSIQRASDLYGRINTVIFSPDDTNMVKLGPELRRRYLDRSVYICDASYLQNWYGYHRILKQRNQLLKKSDRNGLDIWTEQLAETGSRIITSRQHFVQRLNHRLRQHYGTISGNQETACVAYVPEGVRSTEQGQIKTELFELFERHLQNDIHYGTTTAGPHRDDLIFQLNGRLLKSFGSAGQQKSFILALKMAELNTIQEMFGEPPLLLLDDVSSELDPIRSRNFLAFLTDMNIQVFITTTERSPALLGSAAHYAVFRMENGNLTFEGNKSHE